MKLDGCIVWNPTIQYLARSACFTKLNDLHIPTSLSSVMTDMSRDKTVDRQHYVPYAIMSSVAENLAKVSCTECTGHGNYFELIPAVEMEMKHHVEGSVGNEFLWIYNHCGVMAA